MYHFILKEINLQPLLVMDVSKYGISWMLDARQHIQSMASQYGNVNFMIQEIFWFHVQWIILSSFGIWYRQKQVDSHLEVMLTQLTLLIGSHIHACLCLGPVIKQFHCGILGQIFVFKHFTVTITLLTLWNSIKEETWLYQVTVME